MSDARAILALLQGEGPAASRVKGLIDDARRDTAELFISIIDLSEVPTIVGKAKGEEEAWKTWDQIRRLSLTVLPASEGGVFAAAASRSSTLSPRRMPSPRLRQIIPTRLW